MAIRVPWNEHEQVLLLYNLIKLLKHEIERKQAVTEVSAKLRTLAMIHRLPFDDKFRNENGIALQMSKLEYVFTDGKSGLHVDTGWYFDIVQLYRSNQKR